MPSNARLQRTRLRSPLSRKPLGDGTKAMAAVTVGLAAVGVLASQRLLYE